MKFFFTGAGFDLEDKIDWVKLKNLLENKNVDALKLVSDEIKPSDQMSEVSTTLTTLGDTMLKIKKMTDKPEESEKDKKEDKRRLEVRKGFKDTFEKWYQQIVGNYYQDGELKRLEAKRGKLIRYNEIVKTLSNTWADIRNHDSDFLEIKNLCYKKEGIDTDIDAEDGLIEMVERIRIGEEQLREEKKVKEDLQKQDVKRSEAMMKKENIIT